MVSPNNQDLLSSTISICLRRIYNFLGKPKHIVYSDQCLGAGHPPLYKQDVKIIKVGTIILISMMKLACKIAAMFTVSMGTPIFKLAPFVYLCWEIESTLQGMNEERY